MVLLSINFWTVQSSRFARPVKDEREGLHGSIQEELCNFFPSPSCPHLA